MHYNAEKHLLGTRMENSYYTHWLDNYIVKHSKICEGSRQILWHIGASLPSAAIGYQIGMGSHSWVTSSMVNMTERGGRHESCFSFVLADLGSRYRLQGVALRDPNLSSS